MRIAKPFEYYWMPEPNSGCWLWTGALNTWGYGQYSVKGNQVRAHRYSWTLRNGNIPEGMLVLHRCDTPACVNPDHLFLGTQKDNISDCIQKGRFQMGELHHEAKLTKEQVIAIRSDQRSERVIAKSYGVCQATINTVKRRVAYRSVIEIETRKPRILKK